VIPAPTFVSTSAVRDALLAEPSISAPLQIARSADVMMQSVGSVTADAPLFRHGTLTAKDLVELTTAGAVGDALGHFFDHNGQHVPWATDELHIGLTLDDIRACPTSALVAGGDEKFVAIRGAVRGHLANVLVTDASTASRLLAVDQ
jgi:deoxyribonucleoside regulator